ncbi:MAG TPA: hypothetical protein VFW78_09860 [Bacteroidia bacterium]|nr:hypothetical protein [Bacteroidia bacterium]
MLKLKLNAKHATLFNRIINCEVRLFDVSRNSRCAVTERCKTVSYFVASDTKVSPASGDIYTKKVMVFTDRATFTDGSFTSFSAKQIHGLVLVGDTAGWGLVLPNE